MKIGRNSQHCIWQISGTFLLFITVLLTACGGPSPSQKAVTPTTTATPNSVNAPTTMYLVEQSVGDTQLVDHAYLYALRGNDGVQAWQYVTEKGGILSAREVNGQVYVVIVSGSPGGRINTSSLVVLRASNGSVVWRYQASTLLADIYGPVIEKGVVYLGITSELNQNRILAFNSNDGSLLWQYMVPGKTAPSDTIQDILISDIQQYGELLCFTAYSLRHNRTAYTIYALRMKDGAVSWQKTISDKGGIRQLDLLQVHGELEAFYQQTNGRAFTMQRLSDEKILWRQELPDFVGENWWNEDSNLYLLGRDYTNLLNSMVYVLRSTDGILIWQYKTESTINYIVDMGNGNFCVISSSSLTDFYANKPLFIGVDMLRASDGAKLWSHKIEILKVGKSNAFPMVTDEAVYITSYSKDSSGADIGTLAALKVSDGKPLWSKQLKDGTFSYTRVVNGVFYAAATGSICAYRANNGSMLWCRQMNIANSRFTFN